MNGQIIQALLAPVVMISACGLLCVALYNRLASIVTRLRQFHHERLKVYTEFPGRAGAERDALNLRFKGLEHQAHHMLERGRMMRSSLMCMVTCVLSMTVCSLLIGISLIVEHSYPFAVAMFVLGLLLMSAGVVLALLELRISLQQVEYEHGRIVALTLSDIGADKADSLKPSTGA